MMVRSTNNPLPPCCSCTPAPTCIKMQPAASRLRGPCPRLKMTISATSAPLLQYPTAPRAMYRLAMITVHTRIALLNSTGFFMLASSSTKANWPPKAKIMFMTATSCLSAPSQPPAAGTTSCVLAAGSGEASSWYTTMPMANSWAQVPVTNTPDSLARERICGTRCVGVGVGVDTSVCVWWALEVHP